MACVDAQTHRQRCFGSGFEGGQHLGFFGCAVGRGIGFGVELHTVSADSFGRGHGFGDGVHEQAHARAQGFGFCNHRLQALGVLRKRPAVVAGELAFAVGHKCHLMRAHLAHKVHQVMKRVAFNIELAIRPCLEQGREVVHIARANVALIRAWVHGDPSSARL